jgi:hypothetical protein
MTRSADAAPTSLGARSVCERKIDDTTGRRFSYGLCVFLFYTRQARRRARFVLRGRTSARQVHIADFVRSVILPLLSLYV